MKGTGDDAFTLQFARIADVDELTVRLAEQGFRFVER